MRVNMESYLYQGAITMRATEVAPSSPMTIRLSFDLAGVTKKLPME
jgi:hypothetical protein